MTRVLYFAYGSNMEPSQIKARCPGYRFLGVAKAPHYRLVFTRWSRSWNSGTADILPMRGAEVFGVLYEVSMDNLKNLDKYTVSPRAYVRADLQIKLGRQQLPAMTYFAVREGAFLPSRKYLAQIIKGAEAYKLPKKYVAHLMAIQTHDG